MLSVGANSEDTPAVQERDEAQKSDTGQGKSDHNTVPACQEEESNRTEKPKQAGKVLLSLASLLFEIQSVIQNENVRYVEEV